MTEHWVLIGLMGSGKSAVGRVLAERTGRRFVDNDEALAAVNDGRTARQLQEEVGADRLHELEVDALASALDDGSQPAVIGAAAAVVTVEEGVRQLARAAAVVWLRVPVEVLADRVSHDEETHRPLGEDPLQTLTTQLAERAPAYEAVATLIVDEVADAADLADQILAALS